MKRILMLALSCMLLVSLLSLSVGAEETEWVTEEITEELTEEITEEITEEAEPLDVTETESATEDAFEETEDALLSFYDFDAARAWFEERVLPNLTSTLLIIGVGLLELIPAIRSLLKARQAFQKSARDVEAYTEAKIEYDARAEEREKKFLERLEAYDKEIERTREETRRATERFEEIARSYAGLLRESESRLGDTLRRVEGMSRKTEEMVYLGMSNNCELVRSGVARKIAEVEEREDDEQRYDDEISE